jgi:hypothetical protein
VFLLFGDGFNTGEFIAIAKVTNEMIRPIAFIINGLLIISATSYPSWSQEEIRSEVQSDGSVLITNIPDPRSIKLFREVMRELRTDPAVYDRFINAAAERYQLDIDLIRAVIDAESGFDSYAVSTKGAAGLMQLMPETARELGVGNPFDPEQNIDGGSRYLKGLLDKYDGEIRLALAAYNAGPNAVQRYGGIPPYKETQQYVKRVLRSYGSDEDTNREEPSSPVYMEKDSLGNTIITNIPPLKLR